MSKFLTIIVVLLFSGSLSATSYLKLWVNGEEASQMTQGDLFAWEFDVSQQGGTGIFQLILDIDENGIVSEADILLIEFGVTDGETENDGPADSSIVPDGFVYSDFGPFGFAPAYYVMHVTDSLNGSQASAGLQILPMPNPTVTVSGNLSIEDVTAPDPALANIMIGSQIREGYSGYWSGLTNEHGNYVINLPADAIGQEWDVSIFFDEQVSGYTFTRGITFEVTEGANTGYNFVLSLPDAFVYGMLKDEKGQDILLDDGIAVQNTTSGEYFGTEIDQGSYLIPVGFEIGQTSGNFQLELWGDNFPPNYMIPNMWENPDYNFSLSLGDSIEKNVVLTSTDAEIFVEIYKDGQMCEQVFFLEAYSELNGRTKIYTSMDGNGTMHIKSGGQYHINIITDPEYGTPLPDGYTYDGEDYVNASAGDTARFWLVPSVSAVTEHHLKPEALILYQNYPNPFNPETTISYQLSVNSKVKISIFDINGKEIETLLNSQQNAGNYQISFDARNLPSGIYFYKLETPGFSKTKKMILVK